MKKIRLSQDKIALVDRRDYNFINQWKWTFMKHSAPEDGGYAYRKFGKRTVLMHRFIMSANAEELVDHINRHGLDNRRRNLRLVTPTQNAQYSKSHTGTSKYKGVHWCSTRNKWIAKIRVNGRRMHLLQTDDEYMAALAYDKAALKYHGEFAEINGV